VGFRGEIAVTERSRVNGSRDGSRAVDGRGHRESWWLGNEYGREMGVTGRGGG
jgi:hypothetical protein